MRAQQGGISFGEQLTATGLHLAHAQLGVDMAIATHGKVRPPPLSDFLPELPAEEPVEVEDRTFSWWARRLLPLAGGGT